MDESQIEKIIALFEGAHSSALHERHQAAIARLCYSTGDLGFAISDLPKVQQIFELTLGLLGRGLDGFLEPACSLLRYDSLNLTSMAFTAVHAFLYTMQGHYPSPS